MLINLINQPSGCKLVEVKMKIKHASILLSKIKRVLLTTAFQTYMLETQFCFTVEFKGTPCSKLAVSKALIMIFSYFKKAFQCVLLYDCDTLILLFYVICTPNWSILMVITCSIIKYMYPCVKLIEINNFHEENRLFSTIRF